MARFSLESKGEGEYRRSASNARRILLSWDRWLRLLEDSYRLVENPFQRSGERRPKALARSAANGSLPRSRFWRHREEPIPPLVEIADSCSDAASSDLPSRPSAVRQVYSGPDFSVRYFICQCGPDDPPYEEVHQETCLGAVLSGFFSYRTGRWTCALAPGAILLGNKGHAYECGHEHSRGDVSLVFVIKESMIAAVMDCERRPASAAEFKLPFLPAAPNLSVMIGRAQAAAAAANSLWLEEIAYTLVASAMVSGVEQVLKVSSPSARDMGRASDVIEFIESSHTTRLTLAGLAEMAGVSPFHFLRLFRTVTGTTPYRYVVQLRLREAVTRLLRGREPITDIAFDVGFGDLSQFIRTFRAASGLSLSAFRSMYS